MLLNDYVDNQRFVALIDDDEHSAHLLTRSLAAQGLDDVRWYGGPSGGKAKLLSVLDNPANDWPCMIIIDLKMHSGANLDFVSSIQHLVRQKGVPVVVMTQPIQHLGRQALLDAGASEVFFRHAELDAYRQEVAGILGFWMRTKRLDAVGM